MEAQFNKHCDVLLNSNDLKNVFLLTRFNNINNDLIAQKLATSKRHIHKKWLHDYAVKKNCIHELTK